MSILIAGFCPQIASWLTVKSTENLDSHEPFIFLFWITITAAYFLFFLAFYHSVRAVSFAFTKGSTMQKLLAIISLSNTFTGVFGLLNYFLHFDKIALNILEYFTVYAEEGEDDVSSDVPTKTPSDVPARTPSPGVNMFNDHTGREAYQPAVNYSREVAAAAASANDLIVSKSTAVQRFTGAAGAGKLAADAFTTGNKKAAVFFGGLAGITSAVTGLELAKDFKDNYDENMKKSE